MYVTPRLGRWFYGGRGERRHDGDPVIVLWHSFLCDGGMWDGQLPALAELGRVIVFDGPGHGKSEVPPRFTLDDNARALVDALDALAPGPVIMAGLSWGGMLAMRLALLEPKRVRALALIDTSAAAERGHHRLRYRALLALFRSVGIPRWLMDRQIAPLMLSARAREQHPELVARLYSDLGGFSGVGVARAGEAIFGRDDIVASLGRITAPTVVLCGREDRATPLSRSVAIQREIAGSQLEIIERTGHLSALESPDELAALLVAFVRSAFAKNGQS